MELNEFEDGLFDLMNESNTVEDIEIDDINDTFTVGMKDESIFEIRCKEA